MNRFSWKRLAAAGVLTAVSDGLFATVQTMLRGASVMRLWQGVASTLLGPGAFDGRIRTAAIGLLMHIGVAFFWSATFLILAARLPFIGRAIESRGGIVAVAAVYGPMIWVIMSLGVIPLLTRRPPSITPRWWVQFFGHAIFVALPIVAIASGAFSQRKSPASGT